MFQVFCSPGISSRELFGPIRAVCRSWRQAVDDMPSVAARRIVALACAGQTGDPSSAAINKMPSHPLGKPSGGGGVGGDERDGGTQSASASGFPGSPHVAFSRGGGSSDGVVSGERTGAAEEGEEARPVVEGGCDRWWNLVRERFVEGGGFAECDAEDVLGRLEWAAEEEAPGLEDDDGEAGDEGAFPAPGARNDAPGRLAVDGGVGEGGGGGGQGGGRSNEQGAVHEWENEWAESSPRRRKRRILGHLTATRTLCAGGRGLTTAAVVPDKAAGTGRDAEVSGRKGAAAVRRRSWSGWEALALAAVTSSSEDRLALCLWAIRPLMGSDDATGSRVGGRGGGRGRGRWCPGLPRGQVVELLCLILCALRSLDEDRAAGSARLEGDLLACARVLENWDLRRVAADGER